MVIKTPQAQILLKHVVACNHVCATVGVSGTGRLLDAFIKYERHWQHSLFLGANERCCATV